MAADLITVSRIPFSVFLFFLEPFSPLFTIFYVLCGVSDILDGFIARKLHTESERGARLDSIADLFFAAAYAVRILPRLMIPLPVWIWTGVIAAVKATAIIVTSIKERKLNIRHSMLNRLTGLAVFILPLTVYFMNTGIAAILPCAAATAAATEEIYKISKRNKNSSG